MEQSFNNMFHQLQFQKMSFPHTLHEDYEEFKFQKLKNLKLRRRYLTKTISYSLKFSPHNPKILAFANENGEIFICHEDKKKIKTKEKFDAIAEEWSQRILMGIPNPTKKIKDYRLALPIGCLWTHRNSILDIEFMKNNPSTLLTASADATSCLVDLEKGKTEIVLFGHWRSIRSINNHAQQPHLVVSGGREGKIYVWDLRDPGIKVKTDENDFPMFTTDDDKENMPQPQISCTVIHPIGELVGQSAERKSFGRKKSNRSNEPNGIISAKFYENDYVISVQANEQDIKIWDLRKMMEIASKNPYDLNNDSFTINPYTASKSVTSNKTRRKSPFSFLSAKFHEYTATMNKLLKISEKIKMSSKYNQNSFQSLSNYAKDFKIEEGNEWDEYVNLLCNSESSSSDTHPFISSSLLSTNNENVRIEENHKKIQKLISSKLNAMSNIRKGYSSIFIDERQNRLLINSLNHTQLLFNLNNLDCEAPQVFSGHKSSYYVKSCLSPCGNFILSGSVTGGLYMWNINNPGDAPIHFDSFHSDEITCVDWKPSVEKNIACCSDDSTVCILD